MKQPGNGHQALRIPGGEQAARKALSDQAEAEATHPGGEALTAAPEEVEGCSADTISASDGNYLEPPD